MSIRAGLGAGLQNMGNLILQWNQDRTRQQRENEAIQRALAQQKVENDRAQQQLMVSADAQNTQRRLAESTIQQNEAENIDREMRNALTLASNLPGKPVPPELATAWASKPHLTPFMESKPEMYGPDDAGAMMPSGFQESPTFAITESEKYRIAGMNNAARLQRDQIRNNLLQAKLMQDKELAQMANTLGWERVKVMAEGIRSRLGLGYDTLDQAVDLARENNETDIIIAHMRAEAGQGLNPMLSLMGIDQPPAQQIPRPATPGVGQPRPPRDNRGSPAPSKSETSPPRGTSGPGNAPRTPLAPDTNDPAGLNEFRRRPR